MGLLLLLALAAGAAALSPGACLPCDLGAVPQCSQTEVLVVAVARSCFRCPQYECVPRADASAAGQPVVFTTAVQFSTVAQTNTVTVLTTQVATVVENTTTATLSLTTVEAQLPASTTTEPQPTEPPSPSPSQSQSSSSSVRPRRRRRFRYYR